MTTEEALARIDDAIAAASPGERAGLVVALSARIAALGAVLTAPPAAEKPPAEEDVNLDVPEAARRLGISERFLYRHWRDYPFACREGRKLLFNSGGLADYMHKQQGRRR